MCGIAGILRPSLGPDGLRESVTTMTRCLEHRGPDDAGIHLEPGLALGHRRLSVIDTSADGHQPMRSADGRLVLVLNGELYNHGELRRHLELAGTRFRSHCDTEVLLEGCARWGLDTTLERAVGMFAFALWDATERSLCLVRDRLGEKPLFLAHDASGLAFASEPKALLELPWISRDLDPRAISHYLRYGFVPGDACIWSGMSKLAPGTVLRIDAELQARERVYWSLDTVVAAGLERPFDGSLDEAADELEHLLLRSITLQARADVPLGAFLSGGIDSSSVVALMRETVGQVRTFTIGFEEADYDESVHSARVAQALGSEHTALTVTAAEAQAVIPRLPRIWDEPFADPSQIPTTLVSELARRHVTVALSGDGGDELLGGYDRYAHCIRRWQGLRRIPAAARRALGAAITAIPRPLWGLAGRPLSLVGRNGRGERFHQAAAMLAAPDCARIYTALMSQWWEPERVAAVPPSPGYRRDDPGEDDLLFMRRTDLHNYLPDDILVKVDRAAMATGLEVRAPLLDHRVVAFCLSLPTPLLGAMNGGKAPLRRLLHRRVPRELVERPKMGFGVPVGRWITRDLRTWAEDLLSPQTLRAGGVLDPRPVRQLWHDHLAGRRNGEPALWNALMLQAWLQEWR